MTLAIFDLDHTLLAGDSDHAWGQFLAKRGIVDSEEHARRQDHYFAEYQAGRLDIYEYLRFQLSALADNQLADLLGWRREFVESCIRPMISRAALDLVQRHRVLGHDLIIITATNSFITRPIADLFGVDTLLATEPEMRDGQFNGKVDGVPTYREGKVIRLQRWLDDNGRDLGGSWFYSDSHNDLPLLRKVDHPVAVDPDPILEEEAQRQGWTILRLHSDQAAAGA